MPDDVGGISASVTVTTDDLTPGMNRAKAAIDQIEAKFRSLGATAAESTTRIDAGMSKVGGGASKFSYQLQTLGNVVDDLQYVEEQGLRPILNNLMMIHPALGLVAIGFDQAIKHGERWKDLGESLVQLMGALAEGAGFEVDLDQPIDEFTKLKDAAGGFWEYLKRIPGAFGDLSGSAARVQDAAIKAFEAAPDVAMKKRGKALAEAITEYGGGEFLAEMTVPSGNEAVDREEKTALLDLVARAAKGDRSAIFELEERTAGKGVGAAIQGALPGNVEGRKAMEEDSKRGLKEAEADRNERLGEMNEELAVLAEMAEFDASDLATKLSPKQVAEEAALLERGGDLAWRRMLLRQPTATGGTLTLDAFEQATKGVGGVSEEAKQLRAIHEVDKEIAANTAKLDKLRPRKIAR